MAESMRDCWEFLKKASTQSAVGVQVLDQAGGLIRPPARIPRLGSEPLVGVCNPHLSPGETPRLPESRVRISAFSCAGVGVRHYVFFCAIRRRGIHKLADKVVSH